MSNDEVKSILSIHIRMKKRIIELEYRDEHFVDEFGRKGYGNVDCTSSLSLDELKSLRDFVDLKLKERIK